jgi:hypothetical protein
MTDAFDPSVEALRLAAGCITHARLQPRYMEHGPAPLLVVEFRQPAAVQAASPLRGCWLEVTHVFRIERSEFEVRPQAVRTASYLYALHDRRGVELLAWHWQPGPRFLGPDHPHLHVSASLRPWANDAERGLFPLDKIHLPTGPVALAAVVRTLVDEFGVRPLLPDWRERLAALPVL